jgi:hypothetical protein
VAACLGLVVGCYEGPGAPEPPPGSPGGLCYPTQACDLGAACDPVGQYCYDPVNPCRGVFCGDAGLCNPVEGRPTCTCEPGYSNFRYSLYCEPV